MSSFYNLDGIKTELNKRIDRNNALLKAWEKVTFPTKKDGSPFKVMSKNINGANYGKYDYAMQQGKMVLTIYAYSNLSGYISDEIQCYELVKYLKDENKKEKINNYMPKQSYLEQIYLYDLEDIKKAVSNKITYLKDRIKSLNKQIEIVDECYKCFLEKYDLIVKELSNNCSVVIDPGFSNNKNDIYYMILDTVKDRYPYC